jgi:replicative DNA helicase
MATEPKAVKTYAPVPNQKIEEAAKVEEPRLNSLLMKDKNILSTCISGGITHNYFQVESQKNLFAIIARYWDKYGALLTRQAFESVVNQNFSEEMAAKLRTEFDATYSEIVAADDFGLLRSNLVGRYMQRQAFATLQKNYDLLLNSVSGQQKLVENLQSEINQIKAPNTNTFNRTVSLDQMLKETVLPEIRDRQLHPEKYWGVMSGFAPLDSTYHGFVKGRYLVFLAMEGGGKTTMMFNVARNMVVRDSNVAYVTIESNAKDTSTRILTIHAAVNYNRILAGGNDNENGLSPYIMEELEKAGKDLIEGAGSKFHWIQVLQGTTATEILERVNRKRAYTDIDVLFLDYIDVVGKETSHPGRSDLELADVSEKFQSWGRENNILVVTAQQLKSETGKRLYDKMDKSSELRVGVSETSGSKKIAGAADYMFTILIDQETNDRVWLWSTKARQGKSAKRFCLSYDSDSGRIENMPDADGYQQLEDRIKTKISKKDRKSTYADPRNGVKRGERTSTQDAWDAAEEKAKKRDEEKLAETAQQKPPETPQTPPDLAPKPESAQKPSEAVQKPPEVARDAHATQDATKPTDAPQGDINDRNKSLLNNEKPVVDDSFASDTSAEIF